MKHLQASFACISLKQRREKLELAPRAMTDFVHKYGVAEGHCHHRYTAHDTRAPSGHSGRLAARMKKKKKSNTCDGYHGLRQSALDEMVIVLVLSVLKFFRICRFLWHHGTLCSW